MNRLANRSISMKPDNPQEMESDRDRWRDLAVALLEANSRTLDKVENYDTVVIERNTWREVAIKACEMYIVGLYPDKSGAEDLAQELFTEILEEK